MNIFYNNVARTSSRGQAGSDAHRIGKLPPRDVSCGPRAARIPRSHVHVYREANVKVDVMAVTRGVPAEIHEKQTQMVHVVAGEGLIETGERLQEKVRVVTGSVIIIPRGTRHKIVNTGQSLLRFFTVYC